MQIFITSQLAHNKGTCRSFLVQEGTDCADFVFNSPLAKEFNLNEAELSLQHVFIGSEERVEVVGNLFKKAKSMNEPKFYLWKV